MALGIRLEKEKGRGNVEETRAELSDGKHIAVPLNGTYN